MPTGLVVQGGDLYASAWSIAGLMGSPAGSGQLVRVGGGTFDPAA
jgi:hypothetical protein